MMFVWLRQAQPDIAPQASIARKASAGAAPHLIIGCLTDPREAGYTQMAQELQFG